MPNIKSNEKKEEAQSTRTYLTCILSIASQQNLQLYKRALTNKKFWQIFKMHMLGNHRSGFLGFGIFIESNLTSFFFNFVLSGMHNQASRMMLKVHPTNLFQMEPNLTFLCFYF